MNPSERRYTKLDYERQKRMTVQALINQLSKQDPNAEVFGDIINTYLPPMHIETVVKLMGGKCALVLKEQK